MCLKQMHLSLMIRFSKTLNVNHIFFFAIACVLALPRPPQHQEDLNVPQGPEATDSLKLARYNQSRPQLRQEQLILTFYF